MGDKWTMFRNLSSWRFLFEKSGSDEAKRCKKMTNMIRSLDNATSLQLECESLLSFALMHENKMVV